MDDPAPNVPSEKDPPPPYPDEQPKIEDPAPRPPLPGDDPRIFTA